MQIKTSGKKTIVKLSKKEWIQIGEQSGWIKEAQENNDALFIEQLTKAVQEELQQIPEENKKELNNKAKIIKDTLVDKINGGTKSSNSKNNLKKVSVLWPEEIDGLIKELIGAQLTSEQLDGLSQVLGVNIFATNMEYLALGMAIVSLGITGYKLLKRFLQANKDRKEVERIDRGGR